MTKDDRAKKIDTLIRMVWSSLESHLEWTHTDCEEGKDFHKKCIKEYSEIVKLLSELY